MLNRTDVFTFVCVPMLLSLFLILVSYPVLLVTIWYPTAGPSDALHLTASLQAGLIVLRLGAVLGFTCCFTVLFHRFRIGFTYVSTTFNHFHICETVIYPGRA